MAYKTRTARAFNSGGRKDRLRTVLTIIGDDPTQQIRPKKRNKQGYQ